MAIIRNKTREKYTVIDNNIFTNKKLSLKSRGMLVTLLSLPDNWEFNENGLAEIFKDGLTAIKSSLRELEENKYLIRRQERDQNGKFIRNNWIISEIPIVENPITGKPISENDTQLNTNKLNTKNNNICPSNDEQDNQPVTGKEDENHFEEVWEIYPRKEGKNKAYTHYKSWLKGKKFAGKTVKLTERQMWFAVRTYKNECEKKMTEKQYIKMGSTFFNESIYEYVQKNELEGVYNEKNF